MSVEVVTITHLLPYLPSHFTHYHIVWTVKRSAVGIRVLAAYWRGLLEHVTQNPWSLIFSLPKGGENL